MAVIQQVETPLPIKQMFALAVVLLNESFCSTMLLPYVGLLIAHLQNRPPEEAGYVSGLLIGVFMFGQVVSSKLWGIISDTYGRRIPLLIGLFTSGFMMLGFGFSTKVWVCIVFRFFHGLFNGNVLVAKTVLADILDKTNEAKGFSLVSLTFGFGTLIGPAAGGLLYDPANNKAMKWAGFSKEGIFATFPGLLPAFIVFIYTNLAMVVCILFVKESNKNAKPLPQFLTFFIPWFKSNRHVELPSSESRADILERVIRVGSTFQKEEEWRENKTNMEHFEKINNNEELYEDKDKYEMENMSKVVDAKVGSSDSSQERVLAMLEDNIISNNLEKKNSPDDSELSDVEEEEEEEEEHHAVVVLVEAEEPEKQKFGYKEAFQLATTRNVLIIYMFLSGADMAYGEIFPLWAIAKESVGGLGHTSDIVGVYLLSNSAPCVLANLIFHIACRLIPDKMKLWRLSIIGMALAVSLTPFVSYLPHRVHFILVLLCTFIRQWFAAWAYGLITLLTARSAPRGHVGSMYGINQSCGAAMRCVIPVIITPIFAWSIACQRAPPFNHLFVFLLAGVVFVLAAGFSYGICIVEDDGMQQ